MRWGFSWNFSSLCVFKSQANTMCKLPYHLDLICRLLYILNLCDTWSNLLDHLCSITANTLTLNNYQIKSSCVDFAA